MRIMALMGHQRSGTHFLGSCIGSHPTIKYTGEIFGGGKVPGSGKELRERLERVMCGPVDVVCLDTKYNQISRPVEDLLSRYEVKVVHLVRQNYLRLYFSGELHTWRGEHWGDDRVPVFRFNKARFDAIVQEIEGHKRRLGYLADVTMFYEDLTGDVPTYRLPDWASRTICSLARVGYQALVTDVEKEAPVDFMRHLMGVPERLVREYGVGSRE